MILEPTGHFQSYSVKTMNNFMKDIVLIAIDECHCIGSGKASVLNFDTLASYETSPCPIRLLLSNVDP